MIMNNKTINIHVNESSLIPVPLTKVFSNIIIALHWIALQLIFQNKLTEAHKCLIRSMKSAMGKSHSKPIFSVMIHTNQCIVTFTKNVNGIKAMAIPGGNIVTLS